jgi:hypothetical protein
MSSRKLSQRFRKRSWKASLVGLSALLLRGSLCNILLKATWALDSPPALLHPNPAKPLLSQGLFISSTNPKKVPNSFRYLAPSRPTVATLEPLFPPNKSQTNQRIAKPDTSILHSYWYVYLPKASTEDFALYRHHGCYSPA